MSHEHLSSGSSPTGRSSLAVAAILVLCGVLALLAFRLEASAQTSPNDPQFPSQWALGKIRAPEAWDLTKGSASIKVAVVDSGIVSSLPDLQGQLGPGYNAITPGGSTEDDFLGYGWGTLIAGILGAKTNNGIDMAGTAWNVTMLPIKVCDYAGNCDPTDLAEGINWAANNGAQIINISIQSVPQNPSVDAAIAYAIGKGIIVVATAGNVSHHVAYPAALSDVIAVGSTDSNDLVTTWSGRGPQLDIVAPGVNILTLIRAGCCVAQSGSELAAAQVSGALALLLAAGVPASQAPGYLFQGAKDLGPPGWDPEYGRGRLDICGALTAAGIACPPVLATPTWTPTPVPPTATPTRTPTPVPPTATPTWTPTPAPPTATPTRTPTPAPPTATPTWTPTPAPPTATPTWTPTPVSPTATPTRTPTPLPPTATPTWTPTPTQQTEVVSGTLRKPSLTSADKAVALKAGQSLQAKLTWKANAVLGMYLYDPAGQLVAQGTGAGKGRALSYAATTAGTYTLRVALTSGKSVSYTLSTTH